MSDPTSKNQDTPPEASQNDAIDQSRRKLTGAALGVSAVFTLASRPVWANQCTISGMASGNLSAPKVTCEGCTPGFWKQCQHLDSWVGFKPSDSFNTVFGVTQYVDPRTGAPYTLLDVMGLTGQTESGSVNCSALPDSYAVNDMGKDPVSPSLGMHAVAALLNAASGINYGYTAGEIITLFQNNVLTKPAALKDSLAMLNERGCPLS
jgi:hypothetical protein